MEFSTPMEGKLMSDAMKITRTSRRLAGLRPPTTGGSSSTGVSKGTQASKVIEREGAAEAVYTLYWNVGKMSRLISVDETKEWVNNILPPGTKTKFEIYKDADLGGRIDHIVYEVKYSNCCFFPDITV